MALFLLEVPCSHEEHHHGAEVLERIHLVAAMGQPAQRATMHTRACRMRTPDNAEQQCGSVGRVAVPQALVSLLPPVLAA